MEVRNIFLFVIFLSLFLDCFLLCCLWMLTLAFICFASLRILTGNETDCVSRNRPYGSTDTVRSVDPSKLQQSIERTWTLTFFCIFQRIGRVRQKLSFSVILEISTEDRDVIYRDLILLDFPALIRDWEGCLSRDFLVSHQQRTKATETRTDTRTRRLKRVSHEWDTVEIPKAPLDLRCRLKYWCCWKSLIRGLWIFAWFLKKDVL